MFTVVEQPATAGVTLPTPGYLLGTHGVAGSQVYDVLADGFHDTRELVPRDHRHGHHARVDHVPFVVSLVHVHIRPADPTCPDPDQDFIRPWGGFREVNHTKARVPPHQVAVARETLFLVLRRRRMALPRLP